MKNLTVVTGGAGFIGRNIVAELNARGDDHIIVVDHLGMSEKWKNLVGLCYEDYIDKHVFLEMLIDGQFGKIDSILHMGACSATTEKDADYLADNNYRYTRALAEWCLANNTRFVTASSAATYGDGSDGYCDDDAVTPSLKPLNMYGYSKHMFDLWALKNNLYNSLVGLKFFNVFGPYESHKDDMRSVVHKAFYQVKEEGKVCLFKSYQSAYPDGGQKRDFVYVKDAVDVVLYFRDNPDKNGLFNCGTGQARTWVDLAKSVFGAMNQAPDIEFIDMPEHLKGKYQYFTEAETTKLRAAGYTKSFTSLEDGVADYVQNYLMTGLV